MTRIKSVALVFLISTVLSTSASGAIIPLIANLTTSAEPSVDLTGRTTTPYGFAQFVLDTSIPQMTMQVTIYNIDVTGSQTPGTNLDNLGNAHIHVGTAPGNPTFPVRWGFLGTPDNDINPDNLVVTPFVNGVGGTFTSVWDAPEGNPNGVTTLESQIPMILAGLSYINFHTVQNPGGEIRGTLQAVPEPCTYLLLSAGLGAVAMLRRRLR